MFAGVGWLLDGQFSTTPFLFICGLFIGLGLGFYQFFKILKKLEE
jgi:F0F1-type ATP synthase assembly protein I